MDCSQFLVHKKHFVRSRDCTSAVTNINSESNQVPQPAFLVGADIKKFYEKVIGKKALETTNITKQVEKKNVVKPEHKVAASKTPFNINLLMKAVESGNMKEVDKIIAENEESVNSKDQFGWTPLMSACFEGNKEMVELLLGWNPDLNVRDKKGYDCRYLAKSNGHKVVVEVLNKYVVNLNKNYTEEQPHNPVASSKKTPPIYCKLCKQSFENTSYKKHLTSMVHNFNADSKKKMPTLYGIPESNKGFQILVKSGWNKEEGLGPCGKGHKFPPKTILKQDKTGLGAKSYKAKVTHKLEDTRREENLKNTLKRQLRTNRNKAQRHERNLRRMLT